MTEPTIEPAAAPEPFPGDDTATWVYWDDYDTADLPMEYVCTRLRLRRNALLSACDYRLVPDAPWDTAPWLTYRQELRDLPDNTTDPRQAVWPQPPQ